MVEQKTILVIDDDPDFLEFVSIVLSSAGYSVQTAPNARDGLGQMRAQLPDLVIADVMMSYMMNGWSVSRQMADDPELRQIPLVMVSAIVDESEEGVFPEEERRRAGAFMRKPLEPSALLQRVAELTTA